VEQVLEWTSRKTALNVIAITDHNTIAGALEAASLAPDYALEVIVGEEVTSREGHILGLFLRERVPPGLSGLDTVAAIHEQGGLAIAAHPFVQRRDYVKGFGRVPMGIGSRAAAIPFDGIEVRNSFPAFALANRRAGRMQRGREVSALGGSDAHVVEAIGKAFSQFPGRTAADLAAAIRGRGTVPDGSLYGPRVFLAYATYAIDLRRRRAARKAGRKATPK
jgi:predicted metal-dependent phosphoesterase TrpH